MKPYYSHNGIVIYHGDCREILPQVSGAVLFADPPYGVGKADWDDKFTRDWLDLATDCCSVLAITPGIVNLLRMPQRIKGASYRWTLSVYIENAIVRGALGFGNWIPCLIYAHEGHSIYSCSQDATRIVIRGVMPDHPSPKPIDAMLWILQRLPEGMVVDPFCGSGSSLLAAKKLGKSAIGIEIEEKYCEIAAKRLSQEVFDFTPQPAVPTDCQAEQEPLIRSDKA